jgi:hypothetical protein
MPSTDNLAPAWKPGQSGNPGGRVKGVPTLRTRLKRLDDTAFAALKKNLQAKSGAVRQRAFETWVDLRMKTARPEELTAAKQMLEGNFTEAQLVEMQERRKQLTANEAGQSSKQLPGDATNVPNAVKNGSYHGAPLAPPTALPFAVWK